MQQTQRRALAFLSASGFLGWHRVPGQKMQAFDFSANYSEPSYNAGDTFLENVAFGDYALDEVSTVWD
jgi:hypothetical protein